MQPDHHWQEQTLARFMRVSRQHLGLADTPAAIRPSRRLAGNGRLILRSLLVAGSLGALFGGSAFAGESISPDPAKSSETAPRAGETGDEQAAHSPGLSLHGKNR